jgi:uncharacterized integral membrane protein
MRRLRLLVTLPAMVVLVVFAVANREAVTVSLWPFPIGVEAPLFLPILLALFAGLVMGVGWLWLPLTLARRRARRLERRLDPPSTMAPPIDLGPRAAEPPPVVALPAR